MELIRTILSFPSIAAIGTIPELSGLIDNKKVMVNHLKPVFPTIMIQTIKGLTGK
jgi:hypothetical protein